MCPPKIVYTPLPSHATMAPGLSNYRKSAITSTSFRSEILRRIEKVTVFNKVLSSEIRKSLDIEPLLVRIEISQLRWFGLVSRMLQKRLHKQALLPKANGKRPVGRPRTRCANYIKDLGWNRMRLYRSEMMNAYCIGVGKGRQGGPRPP